MHRTNIYLEDRQVAELDLLAARSGVNRSDVVRRLVDQGLAGERTDLGRDLAAIEASFAVLADVDGNEALRAGDGDRERHLGALFSS